MCAEDALAVQLVDAGVDGGVVVERFLALELLRAERHVVVEVEVVAVGRDPGEGPAHAPLEGGDLLVGRARYRGEAQVRMLEVLPRGVDVVGLEGDRTSTRLNSSH